MGLRWDEVYGTEAGYEDPPHGVLNDGSEEDYYIGENKYYDPTPDGAFMDQMEARHLGVRFDRSREAAVQGYVDLQRSILASGAGNDDRLMEQALDKQEEDMKQGPGRGAFLRRRAEVALEALEQYEQYGDDVYEDDAVLLFKGSFKGGSTVYTYAVIKIKGGWYLTGKNSGRLTWDQLVEFWMRMTVVEMWEAEGWLQVNI